MKSTCWSRAGRGSLLAAALGAVLALTAGRADAAGYPLRLATPAGAVTIPARPLRIVSLSPSATDDLYAVGAGAQVVAVDRYSTYPRQAPRTNLSGYTPNVEAIAGYRPDLVLIDSDANGIVAELARLHVPVLVEPPARNLADVYAQITQIAQASGRAGAATAVIAGIRRQVAAIVAAVPRPRRPLTVYHELDQTLYSASSHTFIGQLYTLLGLVDIADKAPSSTGYPQLSAEYVISADPDLIVLADTVCCGQSRATLARRPGWSRISALRTGAVVPVDDAIASEWGPRIVVFLREVAHAVIRLEARER